MRLRHQIYNGCSTNVLIISALWALLCAAPPCSANLRSDVDSAYAARNYERVELLVLRSDATLRELSIEDQVNICLTAGFSLIMLERESDARDYFRRALDADPTLRLDPVRISPKFRVVFDDVKASYQPRKPALEDTLTTATYAISPSARSVMMNLVVPGSGQWLEGKRWRGGLILAGQMAAVGLFVWRLDELHRSREAYLHERDRTRVTAAYDRYYDDTRWTWAAGICAGVIYIVAQTDLALLRHRETFSDHATGRIELMPDGNGGNIVLTLTW